MLNGCKERNSPSRSLDLRIFLLDEEKKGDVRSEAILTGVSQRKRSFDLEIVGLGERGAGTCVRLHSDLGAQQGLGQVY